MRIGVTSHRPNRLWGYNIFTPPYYKLRGLFKEILLSEQCTDARTGMALGGDTVFALAVLDLKKQGVNIKLHCDIPCRGHSSKWINSKDVILYDKILEQADEVTLVSDMDYEPRLMQIRNEHIVNSIDKLICVYDGNNKGGTANCVRYAKGKGVDLILINPNEIEAVAK